MTNDIHIASYILRVAPDHADSVLRFVATQPEIEVIGAGDHQTNKVVLLLETRSERHMTEIVNMLRDQTGVLAISMVEQHIDCEKSMMETVIQ